MGKQALCIQRDSFFDLLKRYAPDALDKDGFTLSLSNDVLKKLFSLPTELVDRDICEYSNQYLQLIPYAVLVNEEGKLLSYIRGNKGSEPRLHDLRSVGFGGHIEARTGNMLNDIIDTLHRELEEEVGIVCGDVFIKELKEHSGESLFVTYVDEGVNHYHLCFQFIVSVQSNEIIKAEEGTIEGLQFFDVAELIDKEEAKEIEIEAWSRQSLLLYMHMNN